MLFGTELIISETYIVPTIIIFLHVTMHPPVTDVPANQFQDKPS